MRKKDLQKKLAKLTGEKVDNSLTVAQLKEAIGKHEESQGESAEKDKGGRPKKKKFIACSLLTLDGKNYEPGQEIPVEKVTAHPRFEKLIKSNLIKVA